MCVAYKRAHILYIEYVNYIKNCPLLFPRTGNMLWQCTYLLIIYRSWIQKDKLITGKTVQVLILFVICATQVLLKIQLIVLYLIYLHKICQMSRADVVCKISLFSFAINNRKNVKTLKNRTASEKCTKYYFTLNMQICLY